MLVARVFHNPSLSQRSTRVSIISTLRPRLFKPLAAGHSGLAPEGKMGIEGHVLEGLRRIFFKLCPTYRGAKGKKWTAWIGTPTYFCTSLWEVGSGTEGDKGSAENMY